MGEMDICNKTDIQIAIDQIVERRFKAEGEPISTDAIDRVIKDRIRKEVEAEFTLIHGVRPY